MSAYQTCSGAGMCAVISVEAQVGPKRGAVGLGVRGAGLALNPQDEVIMAYYQASRQSRERGEGVIDLSFQR